MQRSVTYLLLILAAIAGPAVAIEPTTWTVTLSGALGGTEDAEPAPGYGMTGFQVSFAMATDVGGRLAVRYGQLGLDDPTGAWDQADLDWATIGGEYWFGGDWFDSGMFLALGAYRLDGLREGFVADETSWGLAVGSTAEWRLSENFSINGELSGHWADFDDAQIFILGTLGVGVHF